MERPPSDLRTRREQQREAFRDDVLAVAREIVAADGPDSLTMRKLAQRLGCSPMALYSYFHDKHALLAALAHQGFDALARRFEEERAEAPLTALCSTFLAYARHGIEQPDDYRVIFMTRETRPAGKDKVPDDVYRENPAFAFGLDRVQACLKNGDLVGDPHAITTMLWTTVHGAVAAMLTFPDFPFGSRDAYLVRVVDWAIDALRSGRTTPLV